MAEVSGLLASGFTPNPVFKKVDAIIGDRQQALLQRIVDRAEELDFSLGDFGNDFPEELIEQLVAEFDDDLELAIDEYENTEEVLPHMPPAPNPAALYNRFAVDTKVVDLGSGDGRKAEKAKIRDITLTDKIVPEGDFSRKWKSLNAEKEEDYLVFDNDCVYSSWMLLTQLSDVRSVTIRDGMHVVPDLDYLREAGGVLTDRGVRMSFRQKVFDDIDHGFKGFELSRGYLGVMTYRPRFFFVEFQDGLYQIDPPMLPKTLDAPFNMDRLATPKYDGVQVYFDLKADGTGVATNRAGLARQCNHNIPFNVQIITEFLKGGIYVLLRIMHYRGMVPWHDVNNLQVFCEYVKIDVAGNNILAPGDDKLQKLPTDGHIMRVNEVDYRVKGYVTVDLDGNSWTVFCDYFEKHSYAYNIDQEPTELAEYMFHKEDGIFVFKRVRLRVDKATTTDVGTFLFLAGIF